MRICNDNHNDIDDNDRDIEAGVENKFLRTETSASMKPMLGPVR